MTDWRIFIRQVQVTTHANLKARYRKTFAGFLWVVLNPLVTFAVQAAIFTHALKMNMDNYALFLASGLLPWIFIVQTLEMSTPLIVNSSPILKSFKVHPLIFVAGQILDNFINYVAASILLLIPTLIYFRHFDLSLVFFPLAALTLVVSVCSLSTFLSVLHVFFRDTRFIVGFILSLGFFLTPIFYDISILPEVLQWIARANPLYIIILPFRHLIYNLDANLFFESWINAVLVSFALAASSYLFWQGRKNELYFRL